MIGIAATWMLLAASVFPAQHQPHAASPAGWSWRVDAQAFLNANLQVRKFTDFYGVESQNWIMASVSGPVGRGRLSPFSAHVFLRYRFTHASPVSTAGR